MKRLVIFLSLFIVAMFFFPGCSYNSVIGSGNQISKNFDIDFFEMIDVSSAFEIDVTVGEEQNVKVYADDNLMKYVKIYVKNNTLFLGMEDTHSYDGDIKVVISTKKLQRFDISGASKIDIKNIDSDNFYMDVSGACKGRLSGKVKNLKIDLSGASKLNTVDLRAENVFADISGASKLYIYCSNKLKIDGSGASKIIVYGNPQIKETDFSGVSSISYE